MKLDVTETLTQLVRLPSVNPMGGPVDVATCYEGRVTDFLEELLSRMGLATLRQSVEELPGGTRRENLIARLEGAAGSGGQSLLWEVHQDTVPVTGMTVDPFGAAVRDGRLYGRGACDVKGAMAAMLAALARLCDERPPQMPRLYVAFTANEEHGFTGARRLTELWQSGSDSLLSARPDVCVVAEPTDLQVVVAHKGVVRWNCHVDGRAAHSSQPELGESAIYRMGHVLAALEHYNRDIVSSLADVPRCGRPTLSVGTITGGMSVNTVPELCSIAIDRRLVPGELPAAAQEHAVDFLRDRDDLDFEPRHDEPFIESPGLTDEENGPLAERPSAIARRYGGGGEVVGVPYGTDASIIAEAGVPSVVFGPGSIQQWHTADEWIDLGEIEKASQIYYELAAGGV